MIFLKKNKRAQNLKSQIKNVKNWFCYKRKLERINKAKLLNERKISDVLNTPTQSINNTTSFSSFNSISPMFFDQRINSYLPINKNIIYVPVKIIGGAPFYYQTSFGYGFNPQIQI